MCQSSCTVTIHLMDLLANLQQQIHAHQIPGAPPQPMPGLGSLAGPLGPFGGPMGLPHAAAGPPGLLKAPQDMHREDIKVPLGPAADDRLVRAQLNKLPLKG